MVTKKTIKHPLKSKSDSDFTLIYSNIVIIRVKKIIEYINQAPVKL